MAAKPAAAAAALPTPAAALVYRDWHGKTAAVPAATSVVRCCKVCRLPLSGYTHKECQELRRQSRLPNGPKAERRLGMCDAPDCKTPHRKEDHDANASTRLLPCNHLFCYESAQRYNVKVYPNARCPTCYKRVEYSFYM